VFAKHFMWNPSSAVSIIPSHNTMSSAITHVLLMRIGRNATDEWEKKDVCTTRNFAYVCWFPSTRGLARRQL